MTLPEILAAGIMLVFVVLAIGEATSKVITARRPCTCQKSGGSRG